MFAPSRSMFEERKKSQRVTPQTQSRKQPVRSRNGPTVAKAKTNNPSAVGISHLSTGASYAKPNASRLQ